MMGALDQKYEMAVQAIRTEAAKRRIPFKEMVVRVASDANLIRFPLWNEEFDARLVARAKGGA